MLLRIDANVPVKKGRAVDGMFGRIAQVAVDIEWLLQKGARVILMTHFGRPDGKRVSAYSVRPVAKRLSQLLNCKVPICREIVGEKAERAAARLPDGGVLLLENLRFDPREEKNSPSFAQALGRLADMYVDDAFSVAHRSHASIDAIADILPSYAGPRFAHEVEVLSRLMRAPKKPFVLCMGGLKLKTKLPMLKRLLPSVEVVLIGGALAHTFFAAKGLPLGASAFDEEGVTLAKELIRTWGEKIQLPSDVVVASSLREDARIRLGTPESIRHAERIMDVGPETLKRYAESLSRARTIVWNGPFGYCEREAFSAGTQAMARAIADRIGEAFTVVGGGDTVPVIDGMGLFNKFSFVSMGGGAMLDFLSGDELPGVRVLMG